MDTTTLENLTVSMADRMIYGSSRLGMYSFGGSVDNGPTSRQFYSGGTFLRGWRQYELTNHLGNVLTTISDKKTGVSSGGIGSLIDYYEPDIVSANDYYPFGMTSRVGLSTKGVHYRYGFNGKENDWEAKGWQNQQDYGMRIYDPRVGRFLSVDPLVREFPWYTPYQFAGNNPVNYIDIDGAEPPTSTSQATSARTTPAINITVDPNLLNGRSGGSVRVPQGQMFTSGQVNSGSYAAPSWLSRVDFNRYVPPYAQTASVVQNPHGVYVVGQTTNGTNYCVPVYEVPQKREITWVDRLLIGLQDEKIRQFNINKQEWNVSIQAMETITNDPSTLSDEYLSEVQRRLIGGNATDRDRLYEAELRRRKNLYEINDKHNPAKPLGGSNASIMPDNHLQLWENRSFFDEENNTWWSVEGSGKKAVFHRFSSDEHGAYHWSGSTGKNVNRKGQPVDPVPTQAVPKEVKRKAGYKG